MASRSARLRAASGTAPGPLHQLREVAPAAEQRLDVAALGGQTARFIQVLAHARETLEVDPDEVLRLGQRQVGRAGQAEGAHAIDQPEVDRLGMPAHLGRDGRLRYAEHGRRRGGMDVLVFMEGLDHRLVFRDVGNDAQLDLRVVDAQQPECRPRR